jgi:hypothetical protein
MTDLLLCFAGLSERHFCVMGRFFLCFFDDRFVSFAKAFWNILDQAERIGVWLAEGEKYLRVSVNAACTSIILYVCKFSCNNKKRVKKIKSR